MNLELCAPCLLGLEGIAGDEFKRLGFENVRPENGRVFFSGDYDALARANLWSRYTERILVCVASFRATSFERLFQETKAAAWEQFIPRDAAFPVRGHALHSTLMSVPDCQRIIKKAIVERLKEKYHLDWFAETGARHQVQFLIMKDEVGLYLDTSGLPLHKRGYRAESNEAPLRETLAAALVDIARYRGRGSFLDPFCGSGTIAIEAAMKAQNRAPGLVRSFDAEAWPVMPASCFARARADAAEAVRREPIEVLGRDIDTECVELSKSNAKKAGLSEFIRFERADATIPDSLSAFQGTIVTNPPYGERISDKGSAEEIYRGFSRSIGSLPGKALYVLSAHEQFERHFGRVADKKRKLYNGMIKCDVYMYFK